MTLRTLVSITAGALLLVASCKQLPDDTGGGKVRTNVTGVVVRSDDASGVPGAIVQDVQLATKRDTTDAQGNFSIPYDLDPGQVYSTSIVARMSGFGNDTASVSVVAGTDTALTMVIVADSTSPQTGSSTGEPASIVLIGTDVNSISIRGAGVNESALLTYEVRDSLGNPILGSTPHSVRFSIIGGPGGSEYVFPTTSRINATTGRVTTRLSSGTKPGVIQVQASTRNDSVLSAPSRITIASGPPDSGNVSISREKANIPGLIFDNERARINVILGDRYRNPVPAGTAIYFTTNGGLIQPTGRTDDDGIASVELISANPRPPGGIATVIARTIGDTSIRKSDSLIERSITVTFSGATRIVTQSTPILLPDSGSYLLRYEIQDQFGNPIEAGSNISVTLEGPASGDLKLTGKSDVTTEDTDDTSSTNFSIRIEDNIRGGAQGLFTVRIAVQSRNGDTEATVAGFLQSTGGGGAPGATSTPRSIVLNSVSRRQLSVKGTGANETSRLTFLVLDSLGNPVGNPLDPTQKAFVTFSTNPPGGLGGGEFVYPAGDSTDDNGIVGVTFNAGTKAGVVQVVATTLVPGIGAITASPVQLTIQGGLPDSTKFVAGLSRVNMPGLVKTGPLGVISVQAGDEFGNAAQTGTAVYFSTSLGLIEASASTGDNGTATVSLSGGVATATNGSGMVTIQTVGKNGEDIRRSIPFLFSGAPVITGLPANGFAIVDSGYYAFAFKVSDANGNPLAGGTNISVTVDGPGAENLELTGDVAVVIPDTRDTNFTNFSVTATDRLAAGASGTITIRITVSGENGTAIASHAGSVLSSGEVGGSGGVRRVASLELITAAPQSVSISGTGAKSSATYVFVAKDSTGRALDASNRAYVRFALAPSGGLAGGEVLSIAGDSTNQNGQTTVTFFAGTKAGILQLQAKAVSPGSTDTVAAPTIRLSVHGGPPDSNRVIVSLDRVNMPGLIVNGPVGTIRVQAGDKHNNPAIPGTAFYYTTNIGLAQASSTSDETGLTSAILSGGVLGASNGSGVVTVNTIGENGTAIQKTATFLFSGQTAITGIPASGFLLADSGSYDFTFKVSDANGNPLVSGSQVQVSATGPGSADLELAGDVSRVFPDTKDTNYTNFSVRIQDKTRGGVSGPVTVAVAVTSENGASSTSFSGTQLAEGELVGPGVVRSVASLELESATATNISIRGTGSKETATLTFVAKDSLGRAIDKTNKAYVRYSIAPAGGLGGGEFLSSLADSTNEAGKAIVTFTSGTKAGVLQIQAKTTAAGRPDTIFSTPVRLTIAGGLPDSNRMVVGIGQGNLPGLIKAGQLTSVFVQMGDKYNNPVQPGTAVYFTTSLGLIQASATTDGSGTATAGLSGGASSLTGDGVVTVQTVGENGVGITKTLPFLFTGATEFLEAPSTGFTIPDSGTYSFSLKIGDANGNPLAPGSSIAITSSGPGAEGLELSGDVQVSIPDTKDTVYTRLNVLATDRTRDGVSGAVVLRASVTSPNGNVDYSWSGTQLTSGQSTSAGGVSGYPASIALTGTSVDPNRVLSVQGTGSNENAVIRFLVKDSLGNPLTLARKSWISFSLHGSPVGGAFVFPDSVETDASGSVYATLNSGTTAGVFQVRARTTVGATTITSNPVVFTIAGGLPDSNRVTIWTDKQNYPGLVQAGNLLGTVSVQMGDKYGNPVQPGTAVYFSSNGGVITASAFSNDVGRVTASVYGGGAAPPQGQDTIFVSTVGENNTLISKTFSVTFSGSPVVTTPAVTNDSLTIFDGGYFDLDYLVRDVNGNPLSLGNTISVSVSGTAASGISLSGDANVSTIDTRSASFTSFRVRVSDNAPNGGASGAFTLLISVNGPNGTTTKALYGTLGAPQAITPPSPTVKQPAQIAFVGISASDIFVSGVGALENAVITYEVRDSLGFAIEAFPRAYATFNLAFFPNSFVPGGTQPKLIPSGDSTDNAGRLRVSISSGTSAGIIQVTSTVMVGGNPITSSPVKITVHAGFPDQRHFTMRPSMYNFPGLGWKAFVDQNITVQVADKYSNPVQAGTAVYFHSYHGTMQTGEGPGLTDNRGFVNRILNSANPFPVGADSLSVGPGWSYVVAQTLGEAGVEIKDSVLLLWTGNPVITLTGGPNPFVVPNGGTAAGSHTFTVVDFWGHPMSAGTSISVSAGGASVDGDADVLLFDTQVGGSGVTDFTILLSDSDPIDGLAVEPALLTVTVNHPVLGIFKKVIASGTVD